MALRFGLDMAVRLVEREGAVGLAFDDEKRGKPYFVDFLTPAWRKNLANGLPRNHIFRRALGAAGAVPRVCDVTAGFGGDAVMALSLGCEVWAIERSPLVARVLRDGVERAVREEPSLREIFARFHLIEGEAVESLGRLPERPEVVYLDPMFDKPKKSAKSPKAMQMLQELLGDGPSAEDEAKLFTVAWEAALKRVVVKRPLKARALRPSPTHSYKGQSIRYDVYVKG